MFVYLARTQTQDARRVEMVKWRGGRYSISGLLGDSLTANLEYMPLNTINNALFLEVWALRLKVKEFSYL